MEQTNRTILFEEINPQKDDLYTLIGDVRNMHSLTDSKISEINERLLVKSFEEFLEKFEPKIYGMVDTQNMTFMFSKEDMWKNANTFCVDINMNNPFVKAVFEMMDTCGAEMPPNISTVQLLLNGFRYEAVQELKKLIKQVKEEFLYGEKKRARQILEQIAEHYDQGIICLQVLLEKFPKQIEEIAKPVSNPLVLKAIEGTQIEVTKFSAHFNEYEFAIEEDRREEYSAFIEDFLRERHQQGKAVLNMECLQLCLMHGALGEEHTGFLVEKHGMYQELYAKMLQVFWNEIRPILQNIFGIYAYFKQYTVEDITQEGAMPPAVLIANCTVESIQNVGNRERLATYLETVNDKNHAGNAIWYAIVSGLTYRKEEMQDTVRERFQSTAREQKELFHKEVSHDEENIKALVKILTDYQVISFISIVGKKSTAFSQFVQEGMENYNDTFFTFATMENKEYMVPCIPNFTIIPREFMEITIGKTYQYDEFSQEGVMETQVRKLWLEGLYIEAAYVAAGLVAAWQCPHYLNKYHRGKVNMELSGIAYRIMDDNHQKLTKTTMRREVLYCNDELKEDIERRSHGVVFLPEGNGVIMATDRCMAFQNGSNDCISTVQTLVYMERVLRHETQDFKASHIKNFFQNRPDSIKAKWFDKRKAVNAMIKENEDLTYKLDEANNTCVFEMSFKEISKNRKVTTSN